MHNDGFLSFSLQAIKHEVLGACLQNLRIRSSGNAASQFLEDGKNNIENISDPFVVLVQQKYIAYDFNLERGDISSCQRKSASTLALTLPIGLVLVIAALIVSILLWFKKRRHHAKTESIDENPDYSHEYVDHETALKDKNEYYD